jgi:DNA-binding transcriptional LysR family regulator
MTLDQLQIFIAVAEREHVTRAADALGLAPPSVSAAVASLEREFGTKLFHRVGRGILMTEGGRLLLDEARALVRRADAVKLAMHEFTGLSRGRLPIKASQTIASCRQDWSNFTRLIPASLWRFPSAIRPRSSTP